VTPGGEEGGQNHLEHIQPVSMTHLYLHSNTVSFIVNCMDAV